MSKFATYTREPGHRRGKAHYFVNARNEASIALHRRFGFVEMTRDFWFPKTHFTGGVGILFGCDLTELAWTRG